MMQALIEWTSEKFSNLLSWFTNVIDAWGNTQDLGPKNRHDDQVVSRYQNSDKCGGKSSLARHTENSDIAQAKLVSSKSRCRKRRNRKVGSQAASQKLNVQAADDGTIKSNVVRNDVRNQTVTACPAFARYNKDPIMVESVQFGSFTVRISRNLRFPVSEIQTSSSPQSYAKVVKDCAQWESWGFWDSQLMKKFKTLVNLMDTWRSKKRVFSVTVDGRPSDFFSNPAEVLLRRIQGKMKLFFGEIVEIEEVLIGWNGTARKYIYIGPTKAVVEDNPLAAIKAKSECTPNVQAETKNPNLVSTNKSTPEFTQIVDDDFASWEEKFWDRQIHWVKRKSGKANRKRQRLLERENPIAKREIALMKTKSAETEEDSQDSRKKRQDEFENRQNRRRSTSDSADEADLRSQSHRKLLHVLPSTVKPNQRCKRLAIMEAKCRNLMKKIDQTRNK